MATDYELDVSIDTSLSSLDYWRLCDELTVVQAALLIAGYDPSSKQEYVEGWEIHKRPPGYEGAKAAISRALHCSDINGQLVQEQNYDINGNPYETIEGSVDTALTMVEVGSLKDWLRQRGIKPVFFFPANDD